MSDEVKEFAEKIWKDIKYVKKMLWVALLLKRHNIYKTTSPDTVTITSKWEVIANIQWKVCTIIANMWIED